MNDHITIGGVVCSISGGIGLIYSDVYNLLSHNTQVIGSVCVIITTLSTVLSQWLFKAKGRG
jgi:multisubunit Na+/H+ antiporter MnhG subunit